MKHKAWIVAAAVIVFLFALGLTLYPLVSNIYNERHQSEIRTEYMERVEKTDDGKLAEAWTRAEGYNEAIRPGTQEVDAFSKESLLAASEYYDAQLNIAGDSIMGYVEIPKTGVDLPIYHGTDADTLEIGLGHLLGSSLPVGGVSTHSVITGHSGMAGKKMFSDLDQLQIGDVFYLKVLGETLAYQVDQIKTVQPYDTEYLGLVDGEDHCTLVTCTPFGINTHRLLVRGTRIPYEEAEVIVEETVLEAEPVTSTWEQQYVKSIVMSVAAVAVIGILACVFSLIRRKR